MRNIKTVEENFRRQDSGEHLLPRLEGEDEITDLDRAFHKMAHDLAAEEQQKQQRRLLLNSHLRKPIDELSNDLSMMLQGVLLKPNERGRQRLNEAIANLAKLKKLIDEILEIDAVKMGFTLKLTHCNTKNLIENSLQSVEGLALKGKHQLINKTAENYSLRADGGKIEQVLINLLSNACKYSQPGEPIEIVCQRTESGVKFSVQDKGKGLSAEQCMRVFEKFEQAGERDYNKGIGLGLPICKKIVEQHGGKIGVESQADQGCLFWFEL
ncbi:MAG: HAMP domain-containing sensor histidine kinase [Candidatus Obscuribacterales bacterium]